MSVQVLTVINRDQCIGCFSCMYACSRTFRSVVSCEYAALRVHVYTGMEGAFSIRVCARCTEPDCAAACPAGALLVIEGGGIRLQKEKCIQCGACVAACKIQALRWNRIDRMPMPCVHCGTCARYCPNEVIALCERKEETV